MGTSPDRIKLGNLRTSFADFLWRAQQDTQNTGRAVYQRPQGVALSTLAGAGGFSNFGSLSPYNRSTISPQKVVASSITGLGSAVNTNPETMPIVNNAPDVIL